jgi:hypothetical protein
MSEVQQIVDAKMNTKSGWEAGGDLSLSYLWYHRKGWRNPITSLKGTLNLPISFVTIEKAKPSGTLLSVFKEREFLIP